MALLKHLSVIRRLKWIQPDGHDTGIKVFNCRTRDKQPLIVNNKNLVTWYTCGPTVYDSSHIGHASSFVKFDIIQRVLREHFHLNLVTAMNITDVDDKIIARSNSSNIPIAEIVKRYEKEFWRDMDALDVKRPNCVLRVAENMEIIKRFIETLVKNKQAYLAEDNSIYFDTSAYKKYGNLQNINEEQLENASHKKSNMDFALWKAAKPNEIYWESPWQQGRPGWHIECSALASHIFGAQIDIHAGGLDLRFPHHENEEAQSCQAHDTEQWVNYWIHTGHLHLKNDEKMSKSLKNTISISTLLETTPAKVFRMACLMSHYRSPMEFSSEFMTTASNVLQNYSNFIDTCNNYMNGLIKADINNQTLNLVITEFDSKIHSALVDDFNTPQVVQNLTELISAVNSVLYSAKTSTDNSKSAGVIAASNLVTDTLKMFGIVLDSGSKTQNNDNFVEVMNILNEFRQDVRQISMERKDGKLLELCDGVRSDLQKCKIVLKDHGKLSSWS